MTIKLVSTVTIGVGGASQINFGSIPQDATDLLVQVSGRGTTTASTATLTFNGVTTTTYSSKWMLGTGSATSAGQESAVSAITCQKLVNPSSYTASTFSSGNIFIANYAGSAIKSVLIETVGENNAAANGLAAQAGRWSGTAAITGLALTAAWAEGSTISLYTITKGSGGATVTTA
jgi:hypothetical protein